MFDRLFRSNKPAGNGLHRDGLPWHCVTELSNPFRLNVCAP